MDTTKETRPAAVAAATSSQQAGDIYDRWPWVELTVWTKSMLTALETGVKGGKWFRLIDKVYSESNLQRGYWAVWRNRGAVGADGQTVAQFDQHEAAEIRRLSTELHTGTYRPLPVRRTYIPKLGSTEKRPLGIPAVRDRTVQATLR